MNIDKHRFSCNASRDALRILKKIHQGKKSHLPIESRLRERGVPQEAIVGIEHLVFGNPKAIINRRRAHVRAILAEHAQHQQEASNVIHIYQLAQLSTMLAKKPALQAQQRAARAA